MQTIRVFESFAGYGSQLMALRRLERAHPDKIKVVPVGISEIDPHAIKAYHAVHGEDIPNYGDISKIDWDKVPDFDFFTYSSPCFVAGTLVNTKRGMIPIEEVRVGDEVLTHKNRYQRVLRTGSKVSNDLYRIKGMSFDEIVCTGNHPFYVRKTLDNQAEWVQAARITTDNYVCVLRKNKYNMFWWVRPKSIEPIEGEKAMVFNLEVENDNSYTANDVIVHNCQDFSSAGLQAGGEKGSGTRSSLLWEVERAIQAKRPQWLLMENVPALTTKTFMPLLRRWLDTLTRYGYTNYAKCLNAKDYGVPQSRNRLFVVSTLGREPFFFPKKRRLEKRLCHVLEVDGVPEHFYYTDAQLEGRFASKYKMCKYVQDAYGQDISRCITAHEGKEPLLLQIKEPLLLQVGSIANMNAHESTRRVYSPDGISPTLNCCEGGNLQPKIICDFEGISVNPYKRLEFTDTWDKEKSPALRATGYKDQHCIKMGQRIRRLTPRECFRLMDVDEPYIDRIQAAGISNSQQYKLAGNSIVVDVLAAIFRKMFIDTSNEDAQLTLF